MMRRFSKFCFLIVLICCIGVSTATSEEVPGARHALREEAPKLTRIVLCEDMSGRFPKNSSVVFSISRGKVVCLTEFDSVPDHSIIQHRWFRKDKLVTTARLALEPPRWATFSSLRLRGSDEGPWRVEIVDAHGDTLGCSRFSVTD